jgi:hypothetical protein
VTKQHASGGRFDRRLVSRHAWREARREKISIEMIAQTYDDPDDSRPSEHDERREVWTRWLGDQGIEIVVDVDDGRVVTVWRRGQMP